MVKKKYFSGCFVCIALLSACKKEGLMTYSTTDSIYFPWADGVSLSSDYQKDSLNTSFFWENASIVDKLVKVPVATTGSPAEHDRTFKLEAGVGTTAVSGVNYEPLSESFTFHAGLVVDTVVVRFYRTTDLQTQVVWLNLQLLPSDDFTTNLRTGSNDDGSSNTTKVYDVTLFRLGIDDNLLVTPNGWYENSYGVFSAKKAKLMLEVLNLTSSFLTTLEYLGSSSYYAAIFQRYLTNEKAAGRTVYEDDGTEMTMGEDVQ